VPGCPGAASARDPRGSSVSRLARWAAAAALSALVVSGCATAPGPLDTSAAQDPTDVTADGDATDATGDAPSAADGGGSGDAAGDGDTAADPDAADDGAPPATAHLGPRAEPWPDGLVPDPVPATPRGPPADERTLESVTTIRGEISPKSVVSSQAGLFFAQNMMYRHTITVYDRDHELVATIPDEVRLDDFGLDGPDAPLLGSPVEVAFTPDGRHAYVSNYRMYGPGYERGGDDVCAPEDGYDDSFVYRVDTQTLAIDQVIAVGSVPKYVAVTPDGATVLVTNWCSYDLSVIDAEEGVEVARVPIGRYPRGVAVTDDAQTAYVAVMGSRDVAVVDLTRRAVTDTIEVGRGPRHLVLAPDDDVLYATLNGDGVVARIDLDNGEIARVATGEAPRSMDISADGTVLYVVNYRSDSVSKVRTSDLEVLQTVPTELRPIGITTDRATSEVWVANYSGSIQVFRDR
jgi:YVTN family beta-propeller protein